MTRRLHFLLLSLLLLTVILALSAAPPAVGADLTDCASCHAKYPSDRFDGYSEANPIPTTACNACHVGGHAGAVLTPYGYFAGAESVNFDNPATIQEIHAAHKVTLPTYPDAWLCSTCHAGPTCTTCHAQPVPHGPHTMGSDGTDPYPGILEKYGSGTSISWQALTCTNARCHASLNTTFVPRPSCLGCHAVSKTGHGDIAIKHESTSTAAGCTGDGCHSALTSGGGSSLTTEHATRIDPATGLNYDCSVCHSNPDPARAAEVKAVIAANDTRCGSCHAGAGDHRPLHEADPPAAGCTGETCHNNNLTDEHEVRTDPSGSPYDCSVCHSAVARQEARDAIAAYKASGTKATCSTCHATVLGHHALHEYAAFDAGCIKSGCHASTFLDDEHEARGVTCATCHSNTDPERAATLQAAIDGHQRNCGACHPGMDAGHYAQHEAAPPIGDAFYGADFCEGCHLNNMMDEHARRRAADGSSLTCDTCHASTRSDVQEAILAGRAISGANTPCTACHVIHGSIIGIHESPTTQPGNTIDDLVCGDCHASNLGTEHDNHGLGCSACHDSTNAAVLGAIRARATNCDACHSPYHTERSVSHVATTTASTDGCGSCHDKDPEAGMNVEAVHAGASGGRCLVCHSKTSRAVPLGDKSAECASCHGTSGTDYHRNMSVHTSPDAVSCSNQCHHRSPDVTVVHQNAGGCSACHPSVDIKTTTTACTNCHLVQGVDYHPNYDAWHNPADDQSAGCVRCHGQTTDVRTIHAGANGCETCHTGACADCHYTHGMGGPTMRKTTACSACHVTSGADYHTSIEASHTYSGMDSGCMVTGCHPSNSLPAVHDPYMSRYPAYADSCALCHLNSDPNRIPEGATAGCGSCHANAGDRHLSVHQFTLFDYANCSGSGCHTSWLTDEHEARGLTCTTCHANPDAARAETLQAAIDANDTSCDACHAMSNLPLGGALQISAPASHSSVHYSGPLPDGSDCGTCHSASLLEEHAKPSSETSTGAAITCETCHAGNPSEVSKVKPWDKTCGACHANGGHEMSEPYGACADCHGGANSIHGESAHEDVACATCHASLPGCMQSACHSKSEIHDESRHDPCTRCHTSGFAKPHGPIPSNLVTDGDWERICGNCHGRVHGRGSCAGCHAPSGGSDGGWGDGWGGGGDVHGESHHMKLSGSNPACFQCHNVQRAPADTKTDCLLCHPGGSMPAWNGVITWEYGDLGGTVRDTSGSAISGATVSVGGAGSSTTNGLGGYLLQYLDPGSYTVTASKPGYASQQKTITITADTVTTADFNLRCLQGTLCGTIKDVSGLPLSGVLVSVGTGPSATTGVLGTYSFDLAPGTYSVTASKSGYVSQTKTGVGVVDQKATIADFALVSAPVNLALGKTTTAQSYRTGYEAPKATDGTTSTRWYSNGTSGSQWLKVDLGESKSISKVIIGWYSSYYARSYKIEVSADNSTWTSIYSTSSGSSGTRTHNFSPARLGRYVRVSATSANSSGGYSITEFEVY